MRYASGGGYLHLHLAMRRYEVLPWVLLDRNLGIDTVYLQQSQLTF